MPGACQPLLGTPLASLPDWHGFCLARFLHLPSWHASCTGQVGMLLASRSLARFLRWHASCKPEVGMVLALARFLHRASWHGSCVGTLLALARFLQAGSWHDSCTGGPPHFGTVLASGKLAWFLRAGWLARSLHGGSLARFLQNLRPFERGIQRNVGGQKNVHKKYGEYPTHPRGF